MSRFTFNTGRWVPGAIVSIMALAPSSCSESNPVGDTPEGEGGSPAGAIALPGNEDLPETVVRCGRSCTTDLAAARAALTNDDYQKAFDLYQCADSPEAAFGAGLTRTLLALQSTSAESLLADFGQPPLSATDFVGSNGLLSRVMRRFNGSGDITVTGAQNLELMFDRVRYALGADTPGTGFGRLYGTASQWDASLSVSFWSGTAPAPLVTGERIAISYTCGTSYPTRVTDGQLDWVDLSFDLGQETYWCSLPYSFTATDCQADGGSVVIDAAPVAAGDAVALTLENVLLSCTVDDGTDAAPTAVPTTPSLWVRVSGGFSATAVTSEIDTTGLHPMFGDEGLNLPEDIPRDRTVTDLVAHASGMAAELEEAACFFRIAAEGSGEVFTLPGSLYGAQDMPVSKGDTQVLAAFAMLAAAAGRAGAAYEIDMPLFQLFCDTDPEASDDSADCPAHADTVSAFNAAFGATFHEDRFASARGLVAEALPLLEQGLGNLDETSLLVRNSASGPGLDLMRPVIQALNQSLDAGPVALPNVSPSLPVDVGALFESPKSPQDVEAPFLLYEQTCDGVTCYEETNLNVAFFEQYFAESIQADWDGEYTFSDENAVEATFEEFARSLSRYLPVDD